VEHPSIFVHKGFGPTLQALISAPQAWCCDWSPSTRGLFMSSMCRTVPTSRHSVSRVTRPGDLRNSTHVIIGYQQYSWLPWPPVASRGLPWPPVASFGHWPKHGWECFIGFSHRRCDLGLVFLASYHIRLPSEPRQFSFIQGLNSLQFQSNSLMLGS
jgi:hypothetical protein